MAVAVATAMAAAECVCSYLYSFPHDAMSDESCRVCAVCDVCTENFHSINRDNESIKFINEYVGNPICVVCLSIASENSGKW